jgi:hypothetical protein
LVHYIYWQKETAGRKQEAGSRNTGAACLGTTMAGFYLSGDYNRRT